MATFVAALAAMAIIAAHAAGADGLGLRGLLQSPVCKATGDRCSLYVDKDCCDGLMCTMPLECSSKGARSECQPECRKQTLSTLKRITFPSASGTTPGFEGGKRHKPAVVVMQEWWGVNDAIQADALHLAEQGYRVLIPDLYRGRVALNRTEAIGLSGLLNWTRGVDDIVSAVEYLRATGSKRVGIVGFCQGGGMALCAAEFARVDVANVFYGWPGATTGCTPSRIPPTVPVQMHLGTADMSVQLTRIGPLVNATKAAGVNIKLFTYEGLPHAFMNALTPAGRLLMSGGDPNFRYPNETLVTQAFSRLTNALRLYVR